MIGRTVLAALLAGLLVGLFISGIHQWRLTPLIAAAEAFEHTTEAAPHAHDSNAASTTADHEQGDGWKPAEGFQRIAATSAAWMLSGMGFALLLAGVSMVTGLAITSKNAVVWGLCGFLAISVAPAAGLAPELPGMPAADLTARQVWWVATAVATAVGIYLISSRKGAGWLVAAALIIAAPHLIGAPQPVSHDSAVPAALAASFVGNSMAVAALFWSLLGIGLGLALPRQFDAAGDA
jgi:cobalt transporter subunit CbtA